MEGWVTIWSVRVRVELLTFLRTVPIDTMVFLHGL